MEHYQVEYVHDFLTIYVWVRQTESHSSNTKLFGVRYHQIPIGKEADTLHS